MLVRVLHPPRKPSANSGSTVRMCSQEFSILRGNPQLRVSHVRHPRTRHELHETKSSVITLLNLNVNLFSKDTPYGCSPKNALVTWVCHFVSFPAFRGLLTICPPPPPRLYRTTSILSSAWVAILPGKRAGRGGGGSQRLGGAYGLQVLQAALQGVRPG